MAAVKGVPWWGVTLGAVAVAGVGVWLGGAWFPGCVAVGCVLAALVVRGDGFFAVLAQPPLVVVGVVGAAVLVGKPGLSAVAEVSATFPYLITTMIVVGLVVSGRVLVARVRRRLVA